MPGGTSTSTSDTGDRADRVSALSKPITLSDLTDELLWPRLFRAVPLALRPERLGVAFFTLVILGLLGRIVAPQRAIPEPVLPAIGLLGQAVWARNVHDFVSAELRVLFGVTWSDVTARPWVTVGVAIPAIFVLVIGIGAIARMSACEFAQSVVVSWTRGLAFSITKCLSMVGAVIGPPLLAALLLGIVALAGGALFNWSVSAVLGALIYPVALVFGAMAVLLLLGYALGHTLLVPAVACEGTDAIDAAQRAYAYVVGRPLRLVAYLLILFGVLVVAATVLDVVASRTIELTARAGAALAGPAAKQALGLADGTPEGAWSWVGRIVSFWSAFPRMIVGAFVLSYGASASSVLYLLLRKLNDGQDPSEVWMPGMVGGTLAPVESEVRGDGSMDDE